MTDAIAAPGDGLGFEPGESVEEGGREVEADGQENVVDSLVMGPSILLLAVIAVQLLRTPDAERGRLRGDV